MHSATATSTVTERGPRLTCAPAHAGSPARAGACLALRGDDRTLRPLTASSHTLPAAHAGNNNDPLSGERSCNARRWLCTAFDRQGELQQRCCEPIEDRAAHRRARRSARRAPMSTPAPLTDGAEAPTAGDLSAPAANPNASAAPSPSLRTDGESASSSMAATAGSRQSRSTRQLGVGGQVLRSRAGGSKTWVRHMGTTRLVSTAAAACAAPRPSGGPASGATSHTCMPACMHTCWRVPVGNVLLSPACTRLPACLLA
eukprot:245731-Chlamydomonas_euryale.AAC.1